MEYLASIKVHDPCHAGVLVELHGEFDVSCLVALGQALEKASGLGGSVLVDAAGVTFMDALCIRELAVRSGIGSLGLCRPSRQVRLGVAACGFQDNIVVLPDDDPRYEAAIAEACRCKKAEPAGEVLALLPGTPRRGPAAWAPGAEEAKGGMGPGASLLREALPPPKTDRVPGPGLSMR